MGGLPPVLHALPLSAAAGGISRRSRSSRCCEARSRESSPSVCQAACSRCVTLVRRGVFTHVVMHERLERRHGSQGGDGSPGTRGRPDFGTELIKANVGASAEARRSASSPHGGVDLVGLRARATRTPTRSRSERPKLFAPLLGLCSRSLSGTSAATTGATRGSPPNMPQYTRGHRRRPRRPSIVCIARLRPRSEGSILAARRRRGRPITRSRLAESRTEDACRSRKAGPHALSGDRASPCDHAEYPTTQLSRMVT